MKRRPPFGRTPQDRFERMFAKAENGCWLWTGGKRGHGYGHFWMDGDMKANRAAWLIYVGPIPNGMLVCHRCDNRLCVNPDHLFLGDHKDNMRDMTRKGRQSSGRRHSEIKLRTAAKGEANGSVRLSDAQVLAIFRSPLTGRALAKQYGVTPAQISRIRLGQSWAWLTTPEPA